MIFIQDIISKSIKKEQLNLFDVDIIITGHSFIFLSMLFFLFLFYVYFLHFNLKICCVIILFFKQSMSFCVESGFGL